MRTSNSRTRLAAIGSPVLFSGDIVMTRLPNITGPESRVQQWLSSLDKFDALPEYRTSPLFSERERAALDYVDEATRNKRVSDATFDALRPHFNDREIVELTWLNALENYYNLINLPLGIGSDGLCAIAQRRAAA